LFAGAMDSPTSLKRFLDVPDFSTVELNSLIFLKLFPALCSLRTT
jgi:hypothetical protein